MNSPTLQNFLRTIAQISDATIRADLFAIEAMETGGSYIPARKGDDWASHLVEINLHGITATGASEEEAIRNWTKNARRTMPCGAPRNHAEEIMNVLAGNMVRHPATNIAE